MNIKIIKIIAISFFLILTTFNRAEASVIEFNQSKTNYDIGEEFYIDVYINTLNKNINGIEGNIYYPNNFVEFVRAEEGDSIISLWIEKPKLENGEIILSGIIPNGFSGVIDPFDNTNKLSGKIIRLVFKGKENGNISIWSKNFITTLNDGLGTIENIDRSNIEFFISKNQRDFQFKKEISSKPELNAYVIKDDNIYKGKYVLIFEAKDKIGIKEVIIKEGNRKWKKIKSPYLLEDQLRRSIITVQATNFSDSSIVVSIQGESSKYYKISLAVLIILSLFSLLFFYKKNYVKNKI